MLIASLNTAKSNSSLQKISTRRFRGEWSCILLNLKLQRPLLRMQALQKLQQGLLLGRSQAAEGVHETALVLGELHRGALLLPAEELAEGDLKGGADGFQAANGGIDVFPVPGGNGALGNAGFFRQTIFCPTTLHL